MKKKYIITLSAISILLLFVITISCGYGLWLSKQKNTKMESTTLNCFKIYYSSGQGFLETNNIKPVVNEEGKEKSPITLTITNICPDTKELQLRLNITKENNAPIKGLTIEASGHIQKDVTLYENLTNTKTTDEDITISKLIGLVSVKPNETVRTNIKYWFDERKTPFIDDNKIFRAKFELIDTASSIKSSFAETILSDNKVDKSAPAPDYSKTATTNEGLLYTKDNYGESYYFRGKVDNNYVTFAGLTWRIVRINGDKTVRLILNSSIGSNNYSQYQNQIDYTGLKYIYNNDMINNNINTYLLNWYNSNITSKGFDSYVASSLMCNDTSTTVQYYHTYFSAFNRLINSKTPTLICPQTNNDFGGGYKQKIGLITADEVIMAGATPNFANTSFYLYSGENYFTMTPSEYFNYRVYIFNVTNTGTIINIEPTMISAIRPVINIDSTVTVRGKGTSTNPYVIEKA